MQLPVSMQDVEVLHGPPLVEKLNSLIQLDFDAIVTYHHAIEHCDDVHVRHDLEMFRADHERHIANLAKVVRACEGTPIDVHRDLKGVVLEGITELRSRSGTLGVLRAMRDNERFTNFTYRRASRIALAPIARVVIDQNHADEQRHLAVIQSHIERMSGTAVVTSTGIPSSIPFDERDTLPVHRR
jgi:rubrerythrin